MIVVNQLKAKGSDEPLRLCKSTRTQYKPQSAVCLNVGSTPRVEFVFGRASIDARLKGRLNSLGKILGVRVAAKPIP